MKEYTYLVPYNSKRTMILSIGAVVFGLTLSMTKVFLNTEGGSELFVSLAVMSVVILVVLGFVIYRVNKKFSNRHATITLSEDQISLDIPGQVHAEIKRGEVNTIYLLPEGDLVVVKGRIPTIRVPVTMDGFDEVKEVLMTWQEFEVQTSQIQTPQIHVSLKDVFIVVLFVICFFGSHASKNMLVVNTLSAIVVPLGSYIFYKLHRKRKQYSFTMLRWIVLFITVMIALRFLLSFG